jgi:hypothetical protein
MFLKAHWKCTMLKPIIKIYLYIYLEFSKNSRFFCLRVYFHMSYLLVCIVDQNLSRCLRCLCCRKKSWYCTSICFCFVLFDCCYCCCFLNRRMPFLWPYTVSALIEMQLHPMTRRQSGQHSDHSYVSHCPDSEWVATFSGDWVSSTQWTVSDQMTTLTLLSCCDC